MNRLRMNYIDSLIESTISRDILMMTRVDKPVLQKESKGSETNKPPAGVGGKLEEADTITAPASSC